MGFMLEKGKDKKSPQVQLKKSIPSPSLKQQQKKELAKLSYSEQSKKLSFKKHPFPGHQLSSKPKPSEPKKTIPNTRGSVSSRRTEQNSITGMGKGNPNLPHKDKGDIHKFQIAATAKKSTKKEAVPQRSALATASRSATKSYQISGIGKASTPFHPGKRRTKR
jgi:hypothetical protein